MPGSTAPHDDLDPHGQPSLTGAVAPCNQDAVSAFVMSLLGLMFWAVPLVGLIVSWKANKRAESGREAAAALGGDTWAVAAHPISIAGVVLGLLSTAALAVPVIAVLLVVAVAAGGG